MGKKQRESNVIKNAKRFNALNVGDVIEDQRGLKLKIIRKAPRAEDAVMLWCKCICPCKSKPYVVTFGRDEFKELTSLFGEAKDEVNCLSIKTKPYKRFWKVPPQPTR